MRSAKTCPIATFVHHKPHMDDSQRLATNNLSHGRALLKLIYITYKYSVYTSHRKQYASTRKTNWWLVCREFTTVNCNSHVEYI